MVCFIFFCAKIVNVLGFYFIKDIGLGDFSVFQHVGPVMFYQMWVRGRKIREGSERDQSWNKKFPKRSGGQMRRWIYCMKGMSCVKCSPAGGDREIAATDQKRKRQEKEGEREEKKGVYKLQSFTGVKRADVIDSLCLRSSNNRLMHSDYRPWERRGGGACLCVDMCSHTHMQTTPHTQELKSFLSFSLYLFSHLSKITLPHLLFVSSETLGFSSCYCICNAVQQIGLRHKALVVDVSSSHPWLPLN